MALAAAAPAPAAKATPGRILFTSDWAGPFKVLAADPAGVRRPADVSIIRTRCANRPCDYVELTASPDGRHVAFGSEDLEHVWIRTAHGTLLEMSNVRSLPTWSSDSHRLAYIGSDGLHVANADGSRDRVVDRDKTDASPAWGPPGRGLVFFRRDSSRPTQSLYALRHGRVRALASVPKLCEALSWSADGRFLACAHEVFSSFSLQVLDTRGRPLGKPLTSDAAPRWSPRGSRLLLGSAPRRTGVRIVAAATQHTRLLQTPDDAIAVTWAPDGRRIAYLSRRSNGGSPRPNGDLRVLTLLRKLRTLIPADGAAGGTMTALTWTGDPGATAWPVLPVQDGLLAGGPVSWLAGAGERVAYVACGLPFVWTPSTAASLLLPPPTTESSDEFARGCRNRADRQFAEGIALSGSTAAYDWCACPVLYSSVQAVDLGTSAIHELGHGAGAPGIDHGYGTLLGDDSLLVFSGWESHGILRQSRVVSRQWIQRVDGNACPCPVIAQEPGRLEPLEVDHGRIVAQRGSGTVVLDANGTELLSLNVTPLAAQLTGNHLIVLAPRELREYDATTGSLVRALPLGSLVGRECQGWFDPGCFVGLPSGDICDITGLSTGCEPDWLLEDAARGLVSYVTDDRVHVLRLNDGADAVIGWGALSRFTASGLAYADGDRVHFVPFDALPLR
jgi:Tol biopolymer transport system component